MFTLQADVTPILYYVVILSCLLGSVVAISFLILHSIIVNSVLRRCVCVSGMSYPRVGSWDESCQCSDGRDEDSAS